MTQSQLAHAGDFLRYYESPTNIHTIINAIIPSKVAFAHVPQFADIIRVVQFPDVSFWQGEINYDVMKTKTQAIIIRAGQNQWTDEQFERNYSEAKRAGLLVGVYWFYDDRVSPGKQAEILISLLRNKTLELEVFIDWENSYGGAFGGLSNVVAMMQAVERARLDVKDVGIYTGYYWFRSNSNPVANVSQYAYLRSKPLWEAWYTTNPANVLIPAPWTSLTHWQFGTPAVAWGQQSIEIDMNYFNGTQQEFYTRYGIGEPPPMADYVELKSNTSVGRSIRQQTAYPTVPHIIGSTLGSLAAGQVARAVPTDFYVYANNVTYGGVVQAFAGDRWWKVPINGVMGWIAEIHKGQTLLIATPIDVPTDEYILHVKDGVTRKFILE